MKTGKTIEQLAKEIDSQRTRKLDLVAPTDQMTAHVIENGPSHIGLEIDKKLYPMRDLALTQAAGRVNIPIKYARLMEDTNPDLLAHNLNSWFKKKPERRMVRTLDGEDRAFLSDKFLRIDNFDVATAALDALSGWKDIIIRSTEITESRMYIKVTFPHLQREIVGSPRVGDVVEAGVIISNSEVGLGAAAVTPFALFLNCLNGQTRDGVKRWNHVGSKIAGDELAYLSEETIKAGDKVDLMKIRDTINHALDVTSFEGWIEKVTATIKQPITGRVSSVIETLTERLLLTDKEGDSILTHLVKGGDLSRYGLMNAVTRTAEDAPDYDRATTLESIGNRLVDMPANEWRHIAEAA